MDYEKQVKKFEKIFDKKGSSPKRHVEKFFFDLDDPDGFFDEYKEDDEDDDEEHFYQISYFVFEKSFGLVYTDSRVFFSREGYGESETSFERCKEISIDDKTFTKDSWLLEAIEREAERGDRLFTYEKKLLIFRKEEGGAQLLHLGEDWTEKSAARIWDEWQSANMRMEERFWIDPYDHMDDCVYADALHVKNGPSRAVNKFLNFKGKITVPRYIN